jgi:hypothetical protein
VIPHLHQEIWEALLDSGMEYVRILQLSSSCAQITGLGDGWSLYYYSVAKA